MTTTEISSAIKALPIPKVEARPRSKDSLPARVDAAPKHPPRVGNQSSSTASRRVQPKDRPQSRSKTSLLSAKRAPVTIIQARVVGNKRAGARLETDTQSATAPASDIAGDQSTYAAHSCRISSEQASQEGSSSHSSRDAQNDPTDTSFLVLYRLADILDDLEKSRTANTNRLYQLKKTPMLDEDEVAMLQALVTGLQQLEDSAIKSLEKAMKKSPLYTWAKQSRGVGLKQAARLLAAIGDPYWHAVYNRPRTVSELWAYCGYHTLPVSQRRLDTHGRNTDGNQASDVHDHRDTQTLTDIRVAPVRRKGQRSNWSSEAKMRVYLIAEKCVMQLRKPCAPGQHVKGCTCGKYRVIYDETKAHYADAVHAVNCVRCGPEGKPALAGSPISDAHRHARALRKMSKEILKDMWKASRDAHELAGNHHPADTQPRRIASNQIADDQTTADTHIDGVIGNKRKKKAS